MSVFWGYLCLAVAVSLPWNTHSLFGSSSEEEEEVEYDLPEVADRLSSSSSDVCLPRALGGVDWIMSVKNSEYGWGDQTHRAVIALALNRWRGVSPTDARQIELQLDVEITKSLLRKPTSPIHPNDLVLYVHALIATRRNPRDFYGNDLVRMLLQFVDQSRYDANPFLLLAACNSNAATEEHLHYAKSALKTQLARSNIDLLALALNAYSCMQTMDFEVDEGLIEEAQSTLLTHQIGDGSFGNVYTTSLVVQALAKSVLDWDREAALVFLRSQSTLNPNMVSTYLIQVALHCDEFAFVKSLHPDLPLEPVPIKQDEGHYVQYTIRVGNMAEVYFTITVLVPKNSTFFEVMKLSASHDSKFNFSYYLDHNQQPSVYSISGVPNDAEGNRYWRLCLQSDVNHDRHVSTVETINTSPALLIPKRDDHIIYWFRDSDCR